MADFVDGYNHHTDIGLNTLADVHYGLATAIVDAKPLNVGTPCRDT